MLVQIRQFVADDCVKYLVHTVELFFTQPILRQVQLRHANASQSERQTEIVKYKPHTQVVHGDTKYQLHNQV